MATENDDCCNELWWCGTGGSFEWPVGTPPTNRTSGPYRLQSAADTVCPPPPLTVSCHDITYTVPGEVTFSLVNPSNDCFDTGALTALYGGHNLGTQGWTCATMGLCEIMYLTSDRLHFGGGGFSCLQAYNPFFVIQMAMALRSDNPLGNAVWTIKWYWGLEVNLGYAPDFSIGMTPDSPWVNGSGAAGGVGCLFTSDAYFFNGPNQTGFTPRKVGTFTAYGFSGVVLGTVDLYIS